MKSDFSGWATKAGLKCKDGKTIAHGAFAKQDKVQVPLVWQHGHSDVENVLGHMILENREEGVYAYGFFNDTPKAAHAKSMLAHKDVNALSIWANDLIMRADTVLHGIIREVSLVLAGANPGALIDSITITHGDLEYTPEDEAIIYTGLEIEHGDLNLEHAADDAAESDFDGGRSVADVLETLNEEQQAAFEIAIGQLMLKYDQEAALAVAQSATGGTTVITGAAGTPDTAGTSGTNNDKEPDMGDTNTVKHGVFDQTDDKGGKKTGRAYIAAEAQQGLFQSALAGKVTSLRDFLEEKLPDHLEHGINDIDLLFPDAQAVNTTPEWLTRRTEWVAGFLSGTTKTPFSRIKSLSADLTAEEARAKGYITGDFKEEQFFPVAKRVTTPTTVYKKQQLDRDDMVDITDFDVVAWIKAEMRAMLDEEVARAGLIGDGRNIAAKDKINEQNIRPIATDHELFTTKIQVNLNDSNSSIRELIDAIVMNRPALKGSGRPTMYTTETIISKFLLLRDQVGRDIYRDEAEVATKLRVREIVPVEVMEEETERTGLIAVLVNPIDYTYGATRGGAVTMFDDFDIDFNQYKYLIETRCCGALTKLKSAMAIYGVASNLVLAVPDEPTFDAGTGNGGTVTIPTVTGIVYKNGGGSTITTANSPYAVGAGTSYTVKAFPASGYYLESSDGDEWTYKAKPASS